jgi:hypothetical protein
MNKEFWNTQTRALIIVSIYKSVKVGQVYEITPSRGKRLVGVVVGGTNRQCILPFEFWELAPVSSLLLELL